jgi:hypothetical protein
VFKWDVTPPTAPTGSGTLTWATLLFGAAPSGWSLVATTGETPGYTLYKASIQISDVITATTTNFNWSSSIVQSIGYAGTIGADGAQGADGADGPQGNSYRTAYGKSAVATPNVVNSVQTSGSVSFPTEIYGLTSLVWSASVPTLSAGEYMYQLDGVYNPTTDLTYWATQPYWSTLKVGSLSALSANLGSITSGTITLDSAGHIKGGQTAYATDTGYWLGYDVDKYKFSFGNTDTYVRYNGTSLEVKGNITADDLIVKSATTGAALYIKKDVIMVFDAAGVLRVKLGNLNASETR